MPRKTASRLELRKQAEAAESAEKSAPKKAKKKKRKAAKKRSSRRTKDSAPERKRLVWVIYTATLREEARFPYDQRAEAEEKLEALLSKGKRTYFLQPVKELVSGDPIPPKPDKVDEDEDESPPAESAEVDIDETNEDELDEANVVDEEIEIRSDDEDED